MRLLRIQYSSYIILDSLHTQYFHCEQNSPILCITIFNFCFAKIIVPSRNLPSQRREETNRKRYSRITIDACTPLSSIESREPLIAIDRSSAAANNNRGAGMIEQLNRDPLPPTGRKLLRCRATCVWSGGISIESFASQRFGVLYRVLHKSVPPRARTPSKIEGSYSHAKQSNHASHSSKHGNKRVPLSSEFQKQQATALARFQLGNHPSEEARF